MTVKRYKLDLVSLPVLIHVDHGTDISRFESFIGYQRLRRLIAETARTPFTGIGKPEPLKRELSGYWSRRITDEHRLVHKVTADQLIITSCKTTRSCSLIMIADLPVMTSCL